MGRHLGIPDVSLLTAAGPGQRAVLDSGGCSVALALGLQDTGMQPSQCTVAQLEAWLRPQQEKTGDLPQKFKEAGIVAAIRLMQ